jgi:hypothetical protein
MDSDQYLERLRAEFAPLLPSHRIAFAANVAESLFPAYERFRERENWGDPAALREALDAVWGCLAGRPIGPEERRRHDDATFDNAPDQEEFAGTDDALDACCAVSYAVSACGREDNVPDALAAAKIGYDNARIDVDFSFDDPDRRRTIFAAAPVRAEVRRQAEVLAWLKAHPALGPAEIAEFRSRFG